MPYLPLLYPCTLPTAPVSRSFGLRSSYEIDILDTDQRPRNKSLRLQNWISAAASKPLPRLSFFLQIQQLYLPPTYPNCVDSQLCKNDPRPTIPWSPNTSRTSTSKQFHSATRLFLGRRKRLFFVFRRRGSPFPPTLSILPGRNQKRSHLVGQHGRCASPTHWTDRPLFSCVSFDNVVRSIFIKDRFRCPERYRWFNRQKNKFFGTGGHETIDKPIQIHCSSHSTLTWFRANKPHLALVEHERRHSISCRSEKLGGIADPKNNTWRCRSNHVPVEETVQECPVGATKKDNNAPKVHACSVQIKSRPHQGHGCSRCFCCHHHSIQCTTASTKTCRIMAYPETTGIGGMPPQSQLPRHAQPCCHCHSIRTTKKIGASTRYNQTCKSSRICKTGSGTRKKGCHCHPSRA